MQQTKDWEYRKIFLKLKPNKSTRTEGDFHFASTKFKRTINRISITAPAGQTNKN